MKLLKPVYNAEFKQYTCEVQDAIRRTTIKEADTSSVPLPEVPNSEFIEWLITSTKGWFTKPITEEWLTPRLYQVRETTGVLPSFEGTIEWIVARVSITKDRFTIHWKVESVKEAPKVVIEFEEEKPEGDLNEVESVKDVPEEEGEILGIGPTRRVLHKHKVLKARAKAARALFKAERMTQEYIQLYGEDTDWEDEDSGNESS
jgi:hypothetical protein